MTHLIEDRSGPTPVRKAEHYRTDNVAVIFSATGIGGPPSLTFHELIKVAHYEPWTM